MSATLEAKALAACREQFAAMANVERLRTVIADSLRACDDSASHLAEAYASEEVENDDNNYRTWLTDADKQAILSECPHCMATHNAIQERKQARKRLGNARRAITNIGKSAA
jgi:hypothetical protein